MKKLSIALLGSFLLYLIFNYVFISKSKDVEESMHSEYGIFEVHKAHVLNTQARQEAFDSKSYLTIRNETKTEVFVKVILAKDDSDYMMFLLSPGTEESTGIKPEMYYLKIRYTEGRKFAFSKGNAFIVNDGDQITIKLAKDIFSSIGINGISGPEF
ncbi:MAG: hypothetical protein C4539_17675 [Ignavibacteriales bacterium]|nr:MAG: hypothetical protein C4539_17675 [Ignavibacteriales bacterium]